MTEARSSVVNVAARLSVTARAMPECVAVVEPGQYDRQGKRQYRSLSFAQLEEDSHRIAAGLRRSGVGPGMRVALMVRPGIDFISLVFALFKAGAVIILIDPGMGARRLLHCLAEAEPEGFIGIPLAQAVRWVFRRRFPKIRFLATVGRRWFWGGTTLQALRRTPLSADIPVATAAEDPAAIIFTTGSTGPAKGVLYCHGNFDTQVDEIRDFYGIQPGEIDLACFPLFGLFNCAMGVTAVIPDMNPSRPAQADPAKIVEAIHDWQATQAFGSPAIWARVGPYCQAHGIQLPTLRRVLSAGAPVPSTVLATMKKCIHPEGEVHTPYGATESLPVASASSSLVLGSTAAATAQGAGVCVGHRFPRIEWKVIREVDGPIASMADAEPLPQGEIGELIVRGPVVTRQYLTGREANVLGKVRDGDTIWHRMGDVGYLDVEERFWFCGRLAHRVLTAQGPMYTICCEAIFNQHPQVARSALVGVGVRGSQQPVIVLEPKDRTLLQSAAARTKLLEEARQLGQASELTRPIEAILLHPAFPVDVRHNAKISREQLAAWAEAQMGPGNERS